MYDWLGLSLSLRTDRVDFIFLYGAEDFMDCRENIATAGLEAQRYGTSYIHMELLCYAMTNQAKQSRLNGCIWNGCCAIQTKQILY